MLNFYGLFSWKSRKERKLKEKFQGMERQRHHAMVIDYMMKVPQ